jgi:hypothetical protein
VADCRRHASPIFPVRGDADGGDGPFDEGADDDGVRVSNQIYRDDAPHSQDRVSLAPLQEFIPDRDQAGADEQGGHAGVDDDGVRVANQFGRRLRSLSASPGQDARGVATVQATAVTQLRNEACVYDKTFGFYVKTSCHGKRRGRDRLPISHSLLHPTESV